MNWLALFKRRGGPSGPNGFSDVPTGEWPDIAGKVVVIYSSIESGGGIFGDARLVQVGFNHFVVGRRVALEPSREQRWSGVESWTAIGQVAQMMVFDDVEAARLAFEPEASDNIPAPSNPDTGEA